MQTTAAAFAQDDAEVIIVAPSSNTALYSIASEIHRQLRDNGLDATIVDADYKLPADLHRASLLIGAGNTISQSLRSHYPSLPLIGITTRAQSPDDVYTQLLLQQPLCRQLSLIRALSGQLRRVSIISNGSHGEQLQRCNETASLDIRIIKPENHESLNHVLQQALQADALLAVPDKSIYNHTTVKNILLQSYRKRVPVIGFSRAFVRAGALAAVHSTASQIARQVVELVKQYKHKGQLPAGIQQPEFFNVVVNRQVSDSLQLDIPDSDSLLRTLRKKVSQ